MDTDWFTLVILRPTGSSCSLLLLSLRVVPDFHAVVFNCVLLSLFIIVDHSVALVLFASKPTTKSEYLLVLLLSVVLLLGLHSDRCRQGRSQWLRVVQSVALTPC